jgi:hypothetical protein
MGYLFVTNDLNVVRLLCDRSVIAVSLRGAAGDEAISTDRVLSGPRLLRCANKKQDGPGVRYGKIASPAKAGAQPLSAQEADKWIPAFAEKAIRWRFYPGQVGRPAGGQLAMTVRGRRFDLIEAAMRGD